MVRFAIFTFRASGITLRGLGKVDSVVGCPQETRTTELPWRKAPWAAQRCPTWHSFSSFQWPIIQPARAGWITIPHLDSLRFIQPIGEGSLGLGTRDATRCSPTHSVAL